VRARKRKTVKAATRSTQRSKPAAGRKAPKVRKRAAKPGQPQKAAARKAPTRKTPAPKTSAPKTPARRTPAPQASARKKTVAASKVRPRASSQPKQPTEPAPIEVSLGRTAEANEAPGLIAPTEPPRPTES
jgi:hypothetical protein